MDLYDVVIIGGGPAGLTAAIYASRARLKTLVLESYTVPGQAVLTSDIENYPGFPEGANGFEIIEKFKKQAKNFGAEFNVTNAREIREGRCDKGKIWQVGCGNENINCISIIIATGAHPRELDIPGEKEFRGKGVSYCAVCDAALFKGKDVAVIGGGDTAIEEAVFLTKFVRSVTVVHRRERLRAAKILEERALASGKIKFLWNSVPKEIIGSGRVEALKIEDIRKKEAKTLSLSGIFVFIGYDPNSRFVKGLVKLDNDGCIITDEEMKTSREGIFACGDVRKKILRQVVTACGDGATAAYSARLYIEHYKGIEYK